MNSSNKPGSKPDAPTNTSDPGVDKSKGKQSQGQREVGGPPGPEPTRYGDWEKGGRCIDF